MRIEDRIVYKNVPCNDYTYEAIHYRHLCKAYDEIFEVYNNTENIIVKEYLNKVLLDLMKDLDETRNCDYLKGMGYSR